MFTADDIEFIQKMAAVRLPQIAADYRAATFDRPTGGFCYLEVEDDLLRLASLLERLKHTPQPTTDLPDDPGYYWLSTPGVIEQVVSVYRKGDDPRLRFTPVFDLRPFEKDTFCYVDKFVEQGEKIGYGRPVWMRCQLLGGVH